MIGKSFVTIGGANRTEAKYVSVCVRMFEAAVFVNSSEMLLIITLSKWSKNNCSYFWSKSVVSVALGSIVVIVGGLYFRGTVLYILIFC